MEPLTQIKCDACEYCTCSVTVVDGTFFTSKLVCQMPSKELNIYIYSIGVYGINYNGPSQATLYLAMDDFQFEKIWITGPTDKSMHIKSKQLYGPYQIEDE